MVPTNVEKHLMNHPAVEDVAVVGLPHDIDSEWPLAFVVLSREMHVTAEGLIAYMNGNNGETKYLRRKYR